MNVETWLKKNRHKLSPKTKYEELFVREVIGRVDDIDLRFFSAQMPFKHEWVGNRQCDFSIREGDLVRIAIEVDGYDKTGRGEGMTSKEFVLWERRQAALTAQGWYVLRFANTDVKHNPERCAELVSLLLRELRQMSQHLGDLKNKTDQLQNEVESLRAIRKEHLARAAEDRKKYQKEKAAAEHRAKSAEKKISVVETELQNLQDRTSDEKNLQANERAQLKKQIADLTGELTYWVQERKKHNESKSKWDTKLAEEHRKRELAEKRIGSLEAELEKIRSAQANADKSAPLSVDEEARLESLDPEHEQKIENYKARVKELEAAAQTTEKKVIDPMRHTIWAFAVVTIAAMILIAVISRNSVAPPVVSSSSEVAVSAKDSYDATDTADGGIARNQTRSAETNPSQEASVLDVPIRSPEVADSPEKGESFPAAVAERQTCPNPLDWQAAEEHIGTRSAIAGPVAGISHRPDVSGQPTWISVGATFPDRNRLEIVIWGRNRDELAPFLSEVKQGSSICVIGNITEYREIPQVVVSSSDQVWVH